MVRDEVGRLVPASWPEALGIAADALAAAAGSAAVLVGGRLTAEDAQAYSTFARTVLKTDDVDFRARPSSDEEAAFLTSTIAGTFGPTYSDLDVAPAVVLVAFEPEEESPIVFLRLRKAVTKGIDEGLRGRAVGEPWIVQTRRHRPGCRSRSGDRRHVGVRRADAGVVPARCGSHGRRTRCDVAGSAQLAGRNRSADRCPPRVGAAPCR